MTAPKDRVAAEVARRGHDAVVSDCLALLCGSTDPARVRPLAGPGADKYFDGAEHTDLYWFRVWALRALLWEWDPVATAEVRAAMPDEAWRVREMAAKVAARHLVGEATPELVRLREDPVPRVRAAAERALVRIGSAGA